MSAYWSAADILKQTASELGLTFTSISDTTVISKQLLAALNSAGNEMLLYYPYEQFATEWPFTTQAGVGAYDLPSDWKYFRDNTQWDRTNHWPMLGPKSPQEWAWLKGGLIASFPRTRYRVINNQFNIWPVPPTVNFTPFNMAMEYIRSTWVLQGVSPKEMVTQDGDICQYDPWLLIKYIKLKFYQLKNFDTTSVEKDFMRMFDTLFGKDVGAPVLSMTPVITPVFIGPQSIPDGNWNTGP